MTKTLTTDEVKALANRLFLGSELSFRVARAMYGQEVVVEGLEERLMDEAQLFFCEECRMWKHTDDACDGRDGLCVDCDTFNNDF